VGAGGRRGFGKGRSPTRFSFTYEDFADLLGCSVEAARKHAQRGNYDPHDLISILEFVNERLQRGKDKPLAELLGEVRQAAKRE